MIKLSAGRGRAELAGCSIQKAYAQTIFKVIDTPTDRGLGDPQALSGLSESPNLHNRDERPYIFEFIAHDRI